MDVRLCGAQIDHGEHVWPQTPRAIRVNRGAQYRCPGRHDQVKRAMIRREQSGALIDRLAQQGVTGLTVQMVRSKPDLWERVSRVIAEAYERGYNDGNNAD